MYAIIGAMKEEVEAVMNLAESPIEVLEAPFPLHHFSLGGQEILICRSGIGKVEAALTTTWLLSNYPLEGLLNVGSAGGLQPGQEIGDLVIANELTYHDLLFSAQEPRKGLEAYTFSIESQGLHRMDEIVEETGLRHRVGPIVTGDQFISTEEQYQTILQRCPRAMAAEMEACAIAHVAQRFRCPVVILRAISDLVWQEGNEVDFERYIIKASENSAQLCRSWLKKTKQISQNET